MNPSMIPNGALVLYKQRPALVRQAREKFEVEQQDGAKVKVRSKDLILLHEGPLVSLNELDNPLSGDVLTAWELMAGNVYPLSEVAELIYGEYSPASAWKTWQLVQDGLYFSGNPEAVAAKSPDKVNHEQTVRQAREEEQKAWESFLARVEAGSFSPEDDRYLREVEDLALGRRESSRVLSQLKREESPENAHGFLLSLGYWDDAINPYPIRLELPAAPPDFALLETDEGDRVDLTHLAAFAIDDEGNRDPDDAISLEGGRIWVHVADASAAAPPESRADEEARGRAASLYLPEGVVPMLPAAALEIYGLGLAPISRALSFAIVLSPAGEVETVDIMTSWVRVDRLTYQQAQDRMGEEPFASLFTHAMRYQRRRLVNGAVSIDLPEVRVKVINDQVYFYPVVELDSRIMVREAMLMAGEAAAHFAMKHDIPVPFVTQQPSDREPPSPSAPAGELDLAYMHALRRVQNRSQISGLPGLHAGLGLPAYTRATSPLRRYLDLVAHQQIRAYLRNQELLTEQTMIERIGASEALIGSVARAESLSRQHWTLVHLLRNPGWQGQGILVEKSGPRGRVIIPEMGYEANLNLRGDPPLNAVLDIKFMGASLPELAGFFQVV
jgi:exoribonuclease II